MVSQTLTVVTCNKIRKLLVSRFGSGIFNVTAEKRKSNVGSINIRFLAKRVATNEVLNYLWDNGYDHFIILPQIKESIILSGYVSERNYSLAAFA